MLIFCNMIRPIVWIGPVKRVFMRFRTYLCRRRLARRAACGILQQTTIDLRGDSNMLLHSLTAITENRKRFAILFFLAFLTLC